MYYSYFNLNNYKNELNVIIIVFIFLMPQQTLVFAHHHPDCKSVLCHGFQKARKNLTTNGQKARQTY
jgi:hypothetical protein